MTNEAIYVGTVTHCLPGDRKGNRSHDIHIFYLFIFAFTLSGAYNFFLYMRDSLLLNSAPYWRSISDWAMWIKCLAQRHNPPPRTSLEPVTLRFKVCGSTDWTNEHHMMFIIILTKHVSLKVWNISIFQKLKIRINACLCKCSRSIIYIDLTERCLYDLN